MTTLSRGGNYSGQINLDLISGYLDVWNSWSSTSFLLLVYNIAMLLPLGIILPLLSPKFQTWKAVLFSAFIFTAFVEVFQLISHRGIFELDDLVHNTIGAMAGYLLVKVFLDYRNEKKLRKSTVIKATIIPILYACLFAGAILAYNLQEFGNMSIRPSEGTDMSDVSVSCEVSLYEDRSEVPIYYNVNANQPKRALNIIMVLQRTIGLPKLERTGNDGANKQYVFVKADNVKYFLTYFKRDGTWWLSGDNTADIDSKATDADTRNKIEKILKETSFIPENVILECDQNGTFRWDAAKVDPTRMKKDFLNGTVMVDVALSGEISSIFYGMTENRYVRQVQIISPVEAFEKVKKGEFDSYNPYVKGDKIKITDMQIQYMYDSKGYYQPVYEFTGSLNGEEGACNIMIPALP
jgi:glycopeptide antibiotics resistance protein